MLLAVDVGNGSTSVGLYDGTRRVARFSLATADRSADEYAFLVASLLREAGAPAARVERAILSCVVPALAPRFQAALGRFLPPGEAPLAVGPGVKTGLRIRTDTPGEVGSDLVCGAVAALALVPPPCVVVAFGSAVTFTALDAPADLLGVAIAPGLDVAAAALREGAAQLPQVRLDAPSRAVGRNTAEAVRAGILIGWSGLIDRLTEAVAGELGHPARAVAVVGTGESAEPVLPPSRGFDVYEPYLVLDGLALIAARNDASP